MLTDYHITFKDDGPLGMVIESIDGLAVVVRYSCAPTGEAGPAARLGVSLGSVIVGISGIQCKPLYNEIVPALMKASRPVRLQFQRPAQLLQAVPAPLPLLLWHGSATLCAVVKGHRMSSGTKVDESRLSLMKLNRNRTLKHLDPIVSSPLSLELISDREVCFRLVFRWSALPNVVFQPTKIKIKPGSRQITDSDIREQIEQQAEMSNLEFSVEGKFTSTSSSKQALTLEQYKSHKDPSGPEYSLVEDSNIAPEDFEMIMDDASSHTTLRKLLACRLFPTEVAFQAHGFIGPRVLLEGLLEKWEAPMISGEWRTFWFRLRSDGSLQWFLPDLYSGEKSNKKFVPYPHRPRGGLCISNAAVSSNVRHIQKISKLKPDSLKRMCVFSVEDGRTKLVVRPPYFDPKGEQHDHATRASIKQTWLDAFIRDKRLSGLLQTGGGDSEMGTGIHGGRTVSAGRSLPNSQDSPGRDVAKLRGRGLVYGSESRSERHSDIVSFRTPEKLRVPDEGQNSLSSFDETSRSVEFLYRFELQYAKGLYSPFLQTLSRLRRSKDYMENRFNMVNAPFERFASPISAVSRENGRGINNKNASSHNATHGSSRLLLQLRLLFGERPQHSSLLDILNDALRPDIRRKLEELSRDPKKIFEHPTVVFRTLVDASYDLDDFFYVKQHLPPLKNLEELKLERRRLTEAKRSKRSDSNCFGRLSRAFSKIEGEDRCSGRSSSTSTPVAQCSSEPMETSEQAAFRDQATSGSAEHSELATFERERALSSQTNNSSLSAAPDLHVSKDKYPLFLRRHNFIQLVGYYLGPLCDQYSAGAVFDALVDDTLPVSFRVRAMLSPGDEDLRPVKEMGDRAPLVAGSTSSCEELLGKLSEDDVNFLYHVQQYRRRTVRETLVESWANPANRIDRFERVLTAEPFARYVSAIERSIISQHSGWEWLRHRLDLASTELCVRIEEYMHLSMSVRINPPRNPFLQLDAAMGIRDLFSRGSYSPHDVIVNVHAQHTRAREKLFSVRLPFIMMIPPVVLRDILLQLASDRRAASNRLFHVAKILREECSYIPAGLNRDITDSVKHVLNHFGQVCEPYRLNEDEPMEQLIREESAADFGSRSEGTFVTLPHEPLASPPISSATRHSQANDELDSLEEIDIRNSSRLPPKNARQYSATEDSVYSKGYGSVRLSGTAYITDQNVFFLPSKQEIICFPLRSVSEVDYCTVEKSLSLKGVDDCGLHMRSCEIRRIGCGNEEFTQTQSLLTAAGRIAKADGHCLSRTQAEEWRKELQQFAETLEKTQISLFHGIIELGNWYCQRLDTSTRDQSDSNFFRRECSRRKHLRFTDEVDNDLKVCLNVGEDAVNEVLPEVTTTLIAVLSSKEINCSGQVLPSATFMFSHMKDTLLTRGEERAGGRRRVVAEILKEMLAANKIRKHHTILCSSSTAHSGVRALVSKRSGEKERSMKGWMQQWKEILARDLSEDHMLERRLNIWAALNVIRTRALLKATGRCVTSLLQCTEYYSYYRTLQKATKEPSGGAGSYVRLPSGGTVTLNPLKALQYWVYGHKGGMALEYVRIKHQVSSANHAGDPAASDDRFLKEEYQKDMIHRREELWQAALSNSPSLIQLLCEKEPQWLIRSARYVCRADKFEQERRETKLNVSLQNFRKHLVAFNQLYIRAASVAQSVCQYVLHWESPLLTSVIFVFLLLLPWYDMMAYTVPIFLLLLAGIVLLTGSMMDLGYAPLERFQNIETSKKRGMIERVKSFTGTLIENLDVANEFMEKMHSLFTWRDPPTTRAFVIVMVTVSFTFTLVPSRYIFSAAVLHQFTKPLRKDKAGIVRLSLRRFYSKLPVPSESYNVYYPHEKLKTIETEYPVDAVAPGTQRNISVLRTQSQWTQHR
eukprot:gb/GECG01009072.1/.p1 GENE.gb/GECG01009072.1/~~gb/GECG01009072.1/.p1  ORF type:complete len:1882 (+),score=177.80 gb/GECG01009072.1/:1-5646(+)